MLLTDSEEPIARRAEKWQQILKEEAIVGQKMTLRGKMKANFQWFILFSSNVPYPCVTIEPSLNVSLNIVVTKKLFQRLCLY